MFLRIFLICAFLSVSRAVLHRVYPAGNHRQEMNHGSNNPKQQNVVKNPAQKTRKLNETEMNAYLDKMRIQLSGGVKKIFSKASNICSSNNATLTNEQRRSCRCFSMMGALTAEERYNVKKITMPPLVLFIISMGTTGDPFAVAYATYAKIMSQGRQPGGLISTCSRRRPNNTGAHMARSLLWPASAAWFSVRGRVKIIQARRDATRIMIHITGLRPNRNYGFHIHEHGSCANPGKHYNPFNQTHGGPSDMKRHVGDLGNVYANNGGVARVIKRDYYVSLIGNYSVVERSLVLHELKDDLGRGGNISSLTTGNSGSAIACGIILRGPPPKKV